MKKVTKTNREIATILDPEELQKRVQAEKSEINALEMQFGYKENPESGQDAKKN